jgi:hypothetical protein
MSNIWTEERRRKQAEAIKKHKPWEKSTGPKTAKGKAKASQNALKHGLRGRHANLVRKALLHNREFLKAIVEHQTLEQIANELLKKR